uniref:Uncharacterized protein n=1 Tax=Lactuca sativa TaxID=4236 RepID=A0A9R1VSU3_LACSA|nr:hypothetical protein LSAT_V11C400210610 [Lactuca sativa]
MIFQIMEQNNLNVVNCETVKTMNKQKFVWFNDTLMNGTTSLLDASPTWWEEKIKVDKDFAKSRGTNLSRYEMYYASLFWDSIATGDHFMNPL